MGRCSLYFDKESLTNSSIPKATRWKVSSNSPSTWRHLCSLIYNAWVSWSFCGIRYFRHYSWSFTSKLRTCGLISWFRTLNLKWIAVLGKFRSRFHPLPSVLFIDLQIHYHQEPQVRFAWHAFCEQQRTKSISCKMMLKHEHCCVLSCQHLAYGVSSWLFI